MGQALLLAAPALIACSAPRAQAPDGCGSCHAAEARAHASSRHASSAINAAFTVAFAETDTPGWCAGCHAPEPSGDVGCLVCHDGPGGLRTGRAPTRAGLRAHPLVLDRSLDRVCEGCHEFGLPRGHRMGPSEEPVQATVSEWRIAAPDRGCPECHDHAARGGHDASFVRDALDVRVEPGEPGEPTQVTLTALAVGHHLPTGDGFRRLVVGRCLDPACDELADRTTLGRTFVGPPWQKVGDRTLVPGEPRQVVVPAGPIGVELRLVDPRHEDQLPPADVRTRICGPCP